MSSKLNSTSNQFINRGLPQYIRPFYGRYAPGNVPTHHSSSKRVVLLRAQHVISRNVEGAVHSAYAGSARVSDGSNPLKLGPLSHMFLLVQPDSETHFQPVCLVDVGFGGTCLTKPIYLRDGAVVETSSEKHRLIRAPHPSSMRQCRFRVIMASSNISIRQDRVIMEDPVCVLGKRVLP